MNVFSMKFLNVVWSDLRRLGAFTVSSTVAAGAWENVVSSDFITKSLHGLMMDAKYLLDRVLSIRRYFKNSLNVGSSHGRSAVTMETVDSVSSNRMSSSYLPWNS
ncbi:uncharacterized protein LOC134252461 isoform X2 [Saccostrea cucullata]|uniref:uncharacterized protein LOC134252461 isoform X2 n=1 Tax=Saccostrea cuccullata TaxID=36930 RepID=UPI002ED018C7